MTLSIWPVRPRSARTGRNDAALGCLRLRVLEALSRRRRRSQGSAGPLRPSLQGAQRRGRRMQGRRLRRGMGGRKRPPCRSWLATPRALLAMTGRPTRPSARQRQTAPLRSSQSLGRSRVRQNWQDLTAACGSRRARAAATRSRLDADGRVEQVQERGRRGWDALAALQDAGLPAGRVVPRSRAMPGRGRRAGPPRRCRPGPPPRRCRWCRR